MAPRNDVAERLRELLAEQGTSAGERLPAERELAARLGVSRSSLREGVRRLVDLGIVEARRGSGTYLSPIDLADLFAVRERLEPHAARLAAMRRGLADLDELDDALARMRAQHDDPAAFAAGDLRLHEAIVVASGSRALRVLLAAIAELLRYSRAATAQDPAVRRDTLKHLTRLVEAIHAADADTAEASMAAHLQQVATALSRDGS